MSWTSKIIWSEGMFLRPQHFQQNDRYFEALLENRTAPLRPYAWGVVELTLSQEALSLGKIEIASCRAVMPDGTAVVIPGADAAPPPMVPDKNLKNENVYLCLLERRPNATESSREESDREETRFGVQISDVRDTSLPEDSVAPIELARPRLRLLGEHDEREEFACIPIGRLVEVRADQQLVMDAEYIPTCMDCRNEVTLNGYIKELQGLLKHRAEEIAARLAAEGRGGTPQVQDYLILQVVNRYEPLFAHLASLPHYHPESLFQVCLMLAGELATFLDEGKRPKNLPDYVHTDIAAGFTPLMHELRNLLGHIIESSAEQLVLKEYTKVGIHLAVVNDKGLFENADFVLAVKAAMPSETLRSQFPRQAKIGPKEKMKTLITSQLPGIGLESLPVAPREIPFHSGFNYFRLDRTAELWRELPTSGGLGLHPGKFPDLELELWAIRG